MRTIRSTIFLYVSAGIGSFFVLIVALIYLLSERLITDFVVRDHTRLMASMAGNLEANFQRQLDALSQLARFEEVVDLDPKESGELVKDFLTYANVFSSIHVYDIKGRLISARKRDQVQAYKPEKNIHEMKATEMVALFENVVKSKKPELSDVIKTYRGFVYQAYFVPILDEDQKLAGVLAGAISPNLYDFQYMLRGMNLGDGNGVGLFSKNAEIFTRTTDESLNSVMTRISQTAADGKSEPWRDELAEGKRHFIVFYYPLPFLKYTLALGLDKTVIREKKVQIMKYTFVLLIITSFFSLGISFVLGRRISEPFSKVAAALRHYILGDFKHRTGFRNADETGYLCHLSDTLGEKLEKDTALGLFWTDVEELEKVKRGEPL